MAGEYGLPPEAAVARFLDALLGNEAIVAITTVAGRVEDVWVSDDPSGVDVHAPADEVIVFRFWDGTPWTPPAP